MNEEIKQLREQIATLTTEMNALKSTATIPFEVDQAFRDRLLGGVQVISVSSKSTDSEDVTVVESVNFGGSSVGTTVVLNDPDAFLQINIDGSTYYIPVYTS